MNLKIAPFNIFKIDYIISEKSCMDLKAAYPVVKNSVLLINTEFHYTDVKSITSMIKSALQVDS